MTKVLIVDDEQMICDVLETGLRKRGFLCESVGTGEDALAKLNKEKYHIVLLDVMLPGGESGIEVLRQIWQQHGNVAVIMITAVDSTELAVATKQYGAFGYITKPFDLNTVEASIRTAIQEKFS